MNKKAVEYCVGFLIVAAFFGGVIFYPSYLNAQSEPTPMNQNVKMAIDQIYDGDISRPLDYLLSAAGKNDIDAIFYLGLLQNYPAANTASRIQSDETDYLMQAAKMGHLLAPIYVAERFVFDDDKDVFDHDKLINESHKKQAEQILALLDRLIENQESEKAFQYSRILLGKYDGCGSMNKLCQIRFDKLHIKYPTKPTGLANLSISSLRLPKYSDEEWGLHRFKHGTYAAIFGYSAKQYQVGRWITEKILDRGAPENDKNFVLGWSFILLASKSGSEEAKSYLQQDFFNAFNDNTILTMATIGSMAVRFTIQLETLGQFEEIEDIFLSCQSINIEEDKNICIIRSRMDDIKCRLPDLNGNSFIDTKLYSSCRRALLQEIVQ